MAAPATGDTIVALVSGTSNATQATAENSFSTALAALPRAANTPLLVLGFTYSVASDSQAADYLYTVAAIVQYTYQA